MNIKVLDCTLRDGGYVNNWEFGTKNIIQIISHLSNAGIDYIECGFLQNTDYDPNKTIYTDPDQLPAGNNLCLMVNYPTEIVPESNGVILRIAFKKHDLKNALKYCQILKKRGHRLFINPMVTDSYTESELIDLIKEVNEIEPIALTIADTIGEMTTDDIKTLFNIIDKNLKSNIALCFHSHNNIQMSFANTQQLIELCIDRDLIIDSSIFGMGRGAGNLCTELITKHLNNYNMSDIMKVSHDYIMPIYEKQPWGCSAETYLAAINHCHPNYAKFLTDKHIKQEDMSKIFQSIPDDKKTVFDKELIEKLITSTI